MSQRLDSRWLFFILLSSVWLLISLNFIITLPKVNWFAHDMWGHVKYTSLIHVEKKLPNPYQGFQTYQPPLYYLINQMFSPKTEYHVLKVRLFSIVYGLIFLLSCHIVMDQWNIPRVIQLLVLIYFMSIPAFVHLFTTYNNDSLAMALSGAITAASVKCFFKPKTSLMIFLFVLAVLGVYSKYNVILLFVAIGILLAGAFIVRAVPMKKVLLIVLPLMLGFLTLIPYLRFHNYAHTGKYLPDNADIWPLTPFWDIKAKTGSYLRFFFKPPALTTGEWTDPYAFDTDFHYELSPKLFFWAKRTYLSSVMSTSLFGEYNYSKKVPSADKWAWITLWVQVFLLISISYTNKNVRAMSWFLLSSLFVYALYIRFSHHIFNCVNFRFFSWIVVPLCVLTASELHKRYKENGNKYRLFIVLLIAGSVAHILFFNTLNSNLP